MKQADTIVAVATPPGRGALGIVRMSGPRALALAEGVFQGRKPLVPRRVSFGKLVGEGGVPLDEVLITYMKAPRSYTGEDVVELSCHGGRATLSAVLSLLLGRGARLAEPGEFTRRAFLNGRLDLLQAEAVADVIGAETEASLRAALRQLEGGLSQRLEPLWERMISLASRLEAAIDFPEDIEEELETEAIACEAEGIIDRLAALEQGFRRGRLFREGARLAIVGRPNVGKSSLLNALLREERAIISTLPGTTRDTIEEDAEIRGLPLTIIDTAGLRRGGGEVERAGIERTRRAIEAADLVLLVLDGSEPLTETDREIAGDLEGRRAMVAVNKIDLPRRLEEGALAELLPEKPALLLSAKEGTGLDGLEEAIARVLLGEGDERAGALLTRERHRLAVSCARERLEAAGRGLRRGLSPELVALDLNEALEALGGLLGRTHGEEVLDRIFSEFCLGK